MSVEGEEGKPNTKKRDMRFVFLITFESSADDLPSHCKEKVLDMEFCLLVSTSPKMEELIF